MKGKLHIISERTLKVSRSNGPRHRGSKSLTWNLCWVCCFLSTCSSNGPHVEEVRFESNRRMAERLALLEHESSPNRNPFANNDRVAYYRQLMPPLDSPEWPRAQFQLAVELVFSGNSEEAIVRIEHVMDEFDKQTHKMTKHFVMKLKVMTATAYLRLGEQQNCLEGHDPEACLLPISANSQHQFEKGSRSAINLFQSILEENPDDLETRWLLNIAAMTVGDYPEEVPPQWLIPPDVFESDFPIPRFHDVAARLSLDVLGTAGGSVLEDFDGDGYLDLMVSSWGLRDQIRLFHSNGDGRFRESTKQSGLTGITGGLNMVQADYDNDGLMDVLVLRGAWRGLEGRHPNSLLRNRGDGSFEDVTEAASLLSFHPTQTAAWGDYNNDGLLDLFVGNESIGIFRNPCRLYQNDGQGAFTDVTASANIAADGFVKAVIWGDIDNDGWMDLFVSRLLEPNLLFHNQPSQDGKRHFVEIAEKAGVSNPVHSFTSWFWDFDNDGYLDIFVSGYGSDYFSINAKSVAADYLGLPRDAETPRLYRNQANGTFEDVTKGMGLDSVSFTMGANFGDIDNDGFLDFYLGTGGPSFSTLIPNIMFRNDSGHLFQDVTTAGGFGHLQKGHGISFGDVDLDGDQDVYAVMGGAYEGDVYPNALFKNPGNSNRWIKLLLEGTNANRCAIGARVKIQVETLAGRFNIYSTVSSGGSFGASPLRREIGLGDAIRISALSVSWPGTAKPQLWNGIECNRTYKLKQDHTQAIPLDLKPVSLSPTQDHGNNATSKKHNHHQSLNER